MSSSPPRWFVAGIFVYCGVRKSFNSDKNTKIIIFVGMRSGQTSAKMKNIPTKNQKITFLLEKIVGKWRNLFVNREKCVFGWRFYRQKLRNFEFCRKNSFDTFFNMRIYSDKKVKMFIFVGFQQGLLLYL